MSLGRSTWFLALAVAALPGCAIVSSTPANRGGEGIAYMLPRSLLPVELTFDGSAYEVHVRAPVLVGDTARTYTLQRSGNVLTSDNVTISVDSATGLLSTIDVKSDDKTIPAIVELAKAFRAEAADSAPVVVYRGLYDPGWDVEAARQFNQRLTQAARVHVASLRRQNNCRPDAADDACKQLGALDTNLTAADFNIHVEGGAAEEFPASDCSAGFCYRINVPHVVTLNGPGTSNSAVFGLPNRSPTFVMPLERWAFVKTTHDVKLEGGVFKSVTTDRPSSALALASAPLEIIKGTLQAVAEVLQLKIDLSGKEKALADAKVAELEAKAALDKELIDKAGGGKAEMALAGRDPRSRQSLLAIRMGQPFDATSSLRPAAPSTNPNPAEATSGGSTGVGTGGSPGTGRR